MIEINLLDDYGLPGRRDGRFRKAWRVLGKYMSAVGERLRMIPVLADYQRLKKQLASERECSREAIRDLTEKAAHLQERFEDERLRRSSLEHRIVSALVDSATKFRDSRRADSKQDTLTQYTNATTLAAYFGLAENIPKIKGWLADCHVNIDELAGQRERVTEELTWQLQRRYQLAYSIAVKTCADAVDDIARRQDRLPQFSYKRLFESYGTVSKLIGLISVDPKRAEFKTRHIINEETLHTLLEKIKKEIDKKYRRARKKKP